MPTFDGVTLPRIQVYGAFGGSMDPGATYIHLGVGPGLDTGLLAGPRVDTDITADVRSIGLTAMGAPTDIDAADPVTCTLVLDNRAGDYDPTNPSSPYTGQLTDGLPIRVVATWDGVAYGLFYGELAGITLTIGTSGDDTATFSCRDLLEKLGRAYLPVIEPDRDGDTTGERIAWLADEAGHPDALQDIETGSTTLGRTTAGASALELMRLAESTEFGRLFCDGVGRLVFYGRQHATSDTRSTTVQATFSTAAGTIRLAGLQLDQSREGSYNRVAITRDPAPNEPVSGGGAELGPDDEPVEQIANDLTEQTAKGVLAFPAGVGQLLRNDSEALAMAEYLVNRYAAVTARISNLDVVVLRGEWDTLLALAPLDRISVSVSYGPNTITDELLIQSIAHEIQASPVSWSMTLTTSVPPATPGLWVIGTSQVGVDTLGW